MRTRRREARDESSETARREQCCARCHRTAASHEAASHESAPHESAHEASSHEAAVHGGTRGASKTCPSSVVDVHHNVIRASAVAHWPLHWEAFTEMETPAKSEHAPLLE